MCNTTFVYNEITCTCVASAYKCMYNYSINVQSMYMHLRLDEVQRSHTEHAKV